MATDCDVAIIGAGPAGLTLACALSAAGLRSVLLERQPLAGLEQPPPDGREIALTHRAVAILRALGIWQRFAPQDISPIRQARVLDGVSPSALGFDTQGRGLDALGYLVPNQAIRRAACAAAQACAPVRLLADTTVTAIKSGTDTARLRLPDGSGLGARLVVAADSRLSQARQFMGIGAQTREFGRTAIVCRLTHERPGDGTAWECFGYGRTLAMLPLNGQRVSAVVTVRNSQVDALMQMPPESFAALLQDQFQSRLGDMQLDGARHAYPLVAVYADRFVAARFALAGDAAVGMHPVTAHGFNLGLYGVETLQRTLTQALRRGQDIGSLDLLRGYETTHRRATRPLYLGTNALVDLYTDDRAPARALRGAVLRLAERLPPLKAAITRQLTGVPS